MMKRISIYLLVTVVFLLLNAMSCEKNYHPNSYVRLISIDVNNIDNSGNEMILAEDSIKKEALVLGVKINIKNPNYQSQKPWFTYFHMDFINTRKDIKIYANSDFSHEYPIGSDISHLFDAYTYNYSNKEYDNPPLPPLFDEYSYFLILRKAPDVGEHSFKLVYKSKNKEEEDIIFNTQSIFLY